MDNELHSYFEQYAAMIKEVDNYKDLAIASGKIMLSEFLQVANPISILILKTMYPDLDGILEIKDIPVSVMIQMAIMKGHTSCPDIIAHVLFQIAWDKMQNEVPSFDGNLPLPGETK